MDYLLHYVKNIFCIYIFITVIENLITNEKYLRYIKMFTGIVMIIVIIRPFLSITGIADALPSLTMFSLEKEVENQVYLNIMKAEEGRNAAIAEAYMDTIYEKAESYLVEYDYELQDGDIRLNLDEESSDYGAVEQMTFVVRKKSDQDRVVDKVERITINMEDGTTVSTVSPSEDFVFVLIKNNLANFYNIPVSNIYISEEY